MIIGHYLPNLNKIVAPPTLTPDEHFVRIKELTRSFIQMSLITIPIMETYFLYLLQQKGWDLKDYEIQNCIHDYDKYKFDNERAKPLDCFPERDADGKEYQPPIGYDPLDKWQLAELSYIKISPVLKVINEITYVQNESLANVFLNPAGFLEENGYDRFRLMMMENDITNLIDDVCELVEDKFLHIAFT